MAGFGSVWPRRKAAPIDGIVPMDWRLKLAGWLERLAGELKAHQPPLGQEGVMLQFQQIGTNLGHPVYRVISRRGRLDMGRLAWRNQWRRPAFHPASDAVLDQQCIAEIFAMMKAFK